MLGNWFKESHNQHSMWPINLNRVKQLIGDTNKQIKKKQKKNSSIFHKRLQRHFACVCVNLG